MHVKARHVATAVAVNPIQLAPASTAWLAVAAAVRAAMVVAVVAVVDLAEVAEAAEVVAVAVAVAVAVVAVVAVAVATVAVDLSVADQKSISNSLACDRQWPGHRTSCLGCAVHGAWSPCRAFWHATF